LGFLVGTLAGETVAQDEFDVEEVTVVRYCTVTVMTSEPPGGTLNSTAVGAATNCCPAGPLAKLGAVVARQRRRRRGRGGQRLW
jgi:hypothetical protein